MSSKAKNENLLSVNMNTVSQSEDTYFKNNEDIFSSNHLRQIDLF